MNVGLIPAKWAALTPRAEAFIDASTGRRVTFDEFDRAVRRLSNGLLGLGLDRGDRVAMLSKNSIEYAMTYYACARVGLITQPLNWRLSEPELRAVVDHAEPRVLVAHEEFASVTSELAANVSSVDTWLEYGPDSDGTWDRLIGAAGEDEPEASRHIGDDDPAFILYTGGTTGESKGALHSHRSAAAGMLNQTVVERVQPTDVYMLTGQMFHIPIVLSMNYTAHGCPNVLMNFEPELALQLIETERVSGFLGVTTMLNWMLAVDDFDRYDLGSLRNLMYGGGPMPTSVIREAVDRFPCVPFQGYGQTEGTTMTFLSPADHLAGINGEHPERLRSCGREGFMTTLRVVDDEMKPVPTDGVTAGQIAVRSDANMLGYFRRPELTAQTIIDGWMLTGDVATWDEAHYVTIVDRAKDMIISGGENIYSAQVEEAIGRHPAILETAVIGVPDDEWGESVKAFVVLKPGMQASADEIIDTAKRHLASYQKPRSVEFLDELPKAVTGKILKRTLREPYWSGAERNV